MRYTWLCTFFLFLPIASLWAQNYSDGAGNTAASQYSYDPNPGDDLAYNSQADNDLRTGKVFFRSGQFREAAQSFERVVILPLNQSTTTATYLCGLSYFYQNNLYLAGQRFDQIIKDYSYSRYLDDAIYHKALTHLKAAPAENKLQGLNDLFFLIEKSSRGDIVQDARQSLKQYLFHILSPETIQRFLPYSKPQDLALLTEAICYGYMENEQNYQAQQVYQDFLNRGGIASPFLFQLMGQRKVLHFYEPNVIKIGIFLPLFLNQSFGEGKVPPKSKLALEFYEGFQRAITDYQPYSRKKIFVKVFDTLRDSLRITEQARELESYYPDLVVGEIFNPSSRILSHWTQFRSIPQIVPLSPTLSVKGKGNLFLAHPSVETHGRRMAEHAVYALRLNQVTVWTDHRRITQRISGAFIETFQRLGGQVTILSVDSVFERSKSEILQLVKGPEATQAQAHFIPLPSEEACGLILSELQYQRIETHILGSPEWKYFDAIDQDLKEYFKVVFSSSYFSDNDSSQYAAFYTSFLRQYGLPPSEYHIQGYDLGRYLLQMLDSYSYQGGLPLSAYLRQYALYKGIHLNYYFAGAQDNQQIHICEFRNGDIRKVNQW